MPAKGRLRRDAGCVGQLSPCSNSHVPSPERPALDPGGLGLEPVAAGGLEQRLPTLRRPSAAGLGRMGGPAGSHPLAILPFTDANGGHSRGTDGVRAVRPDEVH